MGAMTHELTMPEGLGKHGRCLWILAQLALGERPQAIANAAGVRVETVRLWGGL